MPVPKASPGIVKSFPTALFEDNGAGLRESIQAPVANVPTAAGNTDAYFIAPEDGILHSVEFSGIEALAANDTNYVTFSVTNLGQNGLGTTVMTAATDVNTSKLTGGSALVANSRRSLTLSTVKGALKVLAGDRLRIRVTGTGTLANGITGGVALARFNP